jgi:hypothetical protein
MYSFNCGETLDLSDVSVNFAIAISRANPDHVFALNAEGNWKACRNVGNPSTVEATWSRRSKTHKAILLMKLVLTSTPQKQNTC